MWTLEWKERKYTPVQKQTLVREYNKCLRDFDLISQHWGLIHPFIHLWLYSHLFDLGSVSWSFTQSVGLLGRGIRPSQGHYLHTEEHKHNKRTQTSMPQVRFETRIPVFEQAKTAHALCGANTMIGHRGLCRFEFRTRKSGTAPCSHLVSVSVRK
jgi:hypothetical protein